MKKSPLIGEVAKDVGWGKLGDTSLSFGEKIHIWAEKFEQSCEPLCENSEFDTTVMEHIMECHKPKSGTECGEANEDTQKTEHFIFT